MADFVTHKLEALANKLLFVICSTCQFTCAGSYRWSREVDVAAAAQIR
jgi:hypothetical protein